MKEMTENTWRHRMEVCWRQRYTLSSFSPVTFINARICPQAFCVLASIFLPHCWQLTRSYRFPVLTCWNPKKTTPQKNFLSNYFKIEVIITSLLEILVGTSTIWFHSSRKTEFSLMFLMQLDITIDVTQKSWCHHLPNFEEMQSVDQDKSRKLNKFYKKYKLSVRM